MVEFRINPNPPRTRRDESAWLDRDRAALRHLDNDDADVQPVEPVPVSFDPSVEVVLEPKPQTPSPVAAKPADAPSRRTAASKQTEASAHPMLASFLKAMPEPGAHWSLEARLEWMRLAESLFGIVYKTEGRIRFVGEPANACDDVPT
jgi:hypothetical protein